MAGTGAGPAGNGGQRQREDHGDAAGLILPGGQGNARPVRQFRMNAAGRVGDAVFSTLARAGLGPAHLLTTRGRKPAGCVPPR